MSGSRSAGRSMDTKDDENEYDKPIVHVESIERGWKVGTSDISHAGKKEKEKESKSHVHEGDTIRTTVTVEDDSPSLYQKLRGKLAAAEEHFRPKDAIHTKKADPHPEVNLSTVQPSNKPHVASEMRKEMWGDKHHNNASKDEVEGKNSKSEVKSKDTKDKTSGPRSIEKYASAKAFFDSETTEDRKVQAGDELGTGYEEGSEEGGFSPSSGTTSGSGSLPKQSESVFKPVKPKDDSEVTLEGLRESKLNQNSSAEDVKAPGVFTRAKEEVEALSDQVSEGLGLKEKRSTSGGETNTGQSGFFSRIAEKIGYGDNHGRSQSH
ncbi:hypothetical protein MPTK1_5g21050 [Marchantia polymorpha subsp. ruderalis]|uniref:Low-temperature-induced 65 kDa protein n=2 Tax=Marchantia polymorpha TaxID=3197 RepID=A0A176WLX3_MARPO|nr:hypothetical protein AXG93_1921s1000 [Marchantia polymorpha subsp. ruderalis]PTQ37311.1 hypothetical protein MARPO_0058s0086 [Marchantia polymorpha]BBN12553.1 hypothetical protein Mp_5g21050 [Marchantia polymorpha subsp. ruderalis]|eukprot:PTQ37311.1 hypothetical protein MARPO_0058s0086 [Marchantia polymorpha]